MLIGQCFGRFDIIHHGHTNMLAYCASFCDDLIVGIASDDYCNAHGMPCIRTWEDRVDVIASIKNVLHVFPYSEHDPLKLWEERQTNVIFLNPEHVNDSTYLAVLPELEKKTRVIWIPRTLGISGTDIKDRIVLERLRQEVGHV